MNNLDIIEWTKQVLKDNDIKTKIIAETPW